MNELEMFKKLGLTEYESRIVLSLLRLGPSTVRQIVNDSRVPKNKAYESLDRLQEKNLVEILPVSPRQYKVQDISKLRDITRQKKDEYDQLNKALDSFEKTLPSIMHSEYKEFFWVIKGQKAIQEKIRLQDEKTARESLNISQLSKMLPQNMRSVARRIKEGMKLKLITRSSLKNEEIVKAWQETGAEIRIYNEKLFGTNMPRFTVFDKKVLRITIGKPEVKREEDYLTLWTESPSLAILFRNYFMNMWEKSIPLEKYLKSKKNLR